MGVELYLLRRLLDTTLAPPTALLGLSAPASGLLPAPCSAVSVEVPPPPSSRENDSSTKWSSASARAESGMGCIDCSIISIIPPKAGDSISTPENIAKSLPFLTTSRGSPAAEKAFGIKSRITCFSNTTL
eukprot:CAMPEP_0196647246 /NCGR_PEP_ID=MMETSP1085-20130531/11637_1 /TAXON_ID=41879 ORGANISM="Pycnococcus sp, Strain CCMP1998" /NCGR_SAMPLE_ID=MMETSP1085 /ASSEMBLY_ACC=CAM_ASM_000807 /LENGTH=129 /DNA_ID=CAMNT_0041976969 /DNA_START=17 /DNA_END=406 /DNA_ORIENTATION=-